MTPIIMKKTLSTLAAIALLPSAASAAATALSATGWNQDIFFSGPGPYGNAAVTGTLDNGPNNFNGYSFYESGTYSVWNGTTGVTTDLSTTGVNSGVYVSAAVAGNGNTFQLQSFTENNALLLNSSQFGTLTLDSPVALAKLALYGTTGAGNTNATLVFNFVGGTQSTYTIGQASGITRDWFTPLLNAEATNAADVQLAQDQVALVVGGRLSNRSEDGFTNLFHQSSTRISIYESVINLTPEDQLKQLESVTITNSGTGGRLAVMALSGEAVPEPSSMALIALCGAAGMLRRRRA